jgi:hypothetical protein
MAGMNRKAIVGYSEPSSILAGDVVCSEKSPVMLQNDTYLTLLLTERDKLLKSAPLHADTLHKNQPKSAKLHQLTENDAYLMKLANECKKLLGTKALSTLHCQSGVECNSKVPKLDLAPHQLVHKAPYSNTDRPIAPVTPPRESANQQQNATLYSFGEPPDGWMPKGQIMSIVRQIDRAYRAKYMGAQNGHL